MKSDHNIRVRPVHLLLLVLLVAVAYSQVTANSFIYAFDDGRYVLTNPHVQAGLTLDEIRWALTSAHAANWHPLTWMSHMLDWQLFGSNPAGHHLTNLALHLASTLLLFLLLNRMTGAPRRSLFVAALFALHPLHVESVAWVAERKDVLSTFFMLLTTAAYLRYVRRPGVGRYLLVMVTFVLGLMAKPMLVSLPFLLLLLDYWPLRRTYVLPGSDARPIPLRQLLLEKAPLLALVAGSCAVTLWAQQSGGAVATLDQFGLGVRAANAVVASVAYIVKMLWPSGLSVFYPHRGNLLPQWQVLGSALVLIGGFVAAVKCARTRPYVTVGWLWYVITLVPVIGLVQVGVQGMADRYTYVPLIGLFVAIAWAVPEIIGKRRGVEVALTVAACAVVLVLAARTHTEVGYWRTDEVLFRRALAVTSNNSTMHYDLGYVLQAQRRYPEAVREYQETFRIDPSDMMARIKLGLLYLDLRKPVLAGEQFIIVARAMPDSDGAVEGVTMSLTAQGKAAEAVRFCEAAVKANPNHGRMHYNLANAYVVMGELEKAIAEFTKAIDLSPQDAQPHHNLGLIYQRRGQINVALTEFRKAVATNPDSPRMHNSLASALCATGDYAAAAAELQKVTQCGGKPNPEVVRTVEEKLGRGG